MSCMQPKIAFSSNWPLTNNTYLPCAFEVLNLTFVSALSPSKVCWGLKPFFLFFSSYDEGTRKVSCGGSSVLWAVVMAITMPEVLNTKVWQTFFLFGLCLILALLLTKIKIRGDNYFLRIAEASCSCSSAQNC